MDLEDEAFEGKKILLDLLAFELEFVVALRLGAMVVTVVAGRTLAMAD
jgi:hypothetical protein